MTEITRILQNWSSATDDARGVVISALYDDHAPMRGAICATNNV